MWIHHGETVIVNDENKEEYDDETIKSLSQYSAELDHSNRRSSYGQPATGVHHSKKQHDPRPWRLATQAASTTATLCAICSNKIVLAICLSSSVAINASFNDLC